MLGAEEYLLEVCPEKQAQEAAEWLAAGKDLELLSEDEAGQYAAFEAPKRRLEWLAGRIAAKGALKAYIMEKTGKSLSLAQIEIANSSLGQPYCRFPNPLAASLPAPCFSISHSRGVGLCAVARTTGKRIGVDGEAVEPRSEDFVKTAFHILEARLAQGSSEEATRLWILKEAVLKFLGLGLNPHEVNLVPSLKLTGQALQAWQKLGSPNIRTRTLSDQGLMIGLAY